MKITNSFSQRDKYMKNVNRTQKSLRSLLKGVYSPYIVIWSIFWEDLMETADGMLEPVWCGNGQSRSTEEPMQSFYPPARDRASKGVQAHPPTTPTPHHPSL